MEICRTLGKRPKGKQHGLTSALRGQVQVGYASEASFACGTEWLFLNGIFFHPSAIREVSSVYLRFLIFLLAILIPACASSSPAFLMMYSAYKLSKQGDNIQP